MLLSVVTGTYNRIEILQRMIESVRVQIPRHIEYEIVAVDGGSTDGSLEWLRSQDDIQLIEQGELRGAINAFCEGAKAAQGEYVLLANDDVLFAWGGILRAIAHLEDMPTCGAVAFSDNRSQQIGRADGYRVEVMPARLPSGEGVGVPYAQVGLYPKWIGEAVGWWGVDDPIMSKSRTYGGDNFLSAGIWEMGYTVDAVIGCQVEDMIIRDELRTINNDPTQREIDSQTYYDRYPEGPQLRAEPELPPTNKGRMRILVLPIYEPAFPGRNNLEDGLTEAFARVGLTFEIDYVNEELDIIRAVRAWRPHILLTQFHDTNHITPYSLAKARSVCPEMVVINWNGDAHEEGLLSSSMIDLLRGYDLQTVVNAKVLAEYDRIGIKAAYWQIAYKDPAERFKGEVPIHDVLFLGNCYNDERYLLVGSLHALDKVNLGIYGSCPGSMGNTHYDFAMSRALYENCKIAISDTFPNTEGFVSNRLFQAMSGGAFVLQQHSPRLEEFTGLKAGTHYAEWNTLSDLRKLVKKWLRPSMQERRAKIAACGMEYVRQNFSYDAQIEKLWGLLP